MTMVALPTDSGWHYVDVQYIQAIKHEGPGRAVVMLVGGEMIAVSEESHVVHKRIQDLLDPPSDQPEPSEP